jgi:hypothetical protein
MIDVKNKKCKKDGCQTQPNYNMPNETKGLYCAKHKKVGMVDVINKTCIEFNCEIISRYGIPTNKPTYCTRHKKENMIKDPTKRCNIENCKNIAIYGIDISLHCEEHKETKEICLVQRKCKGCGTIDVLSPNEICLTYCEKAKEFEKYKKYQKQKQLRVQQILIEKIGEPDRIEESIEQDCGKERVDFMYECKTHNIGIEADEKQHKYNCELGEFNRMKNIFFALGQDAPLIFIRYNPDNFRVNGVLQKIPQSKKEDELIRWVKHYMENIPEHICSVLYLFYDEYSQENVKIFSFDPYDTRTFCCDKCDEVFYIESMFNDHKC